MSQVSSSGPTGITVSPAIEQLITQPGQVSAIFTTQITNHTAKPVLINVRSNDFTALNNQGGVRFYGPGYNPKSNPHGLASVLMPMTPQLLLQPGQDRQLTVSINNLNALAVGGHYGALVYYVGVLDTPAHAQLINNQVLSTLVFLSTAGQGTQSLALSQPQVSGFYFKLPSSLQFVLTDTGNTQTTPRGYVSLRGSNGHEFARGLVNADSGLVLPASDRLFSVDLSSEKRSLFGGHYRYVVAYRPDSGHNFTYYQKSFFVLGPFWPWFALVVLVLLFLLPKIKRRWSESGEAVPVTKKIEIKSVDK